MVAASTISYGAVCLDILRQRTFVAAQSSFFLGFIVLRIIAGSWTFLAVWLWVAVVTLLSLLPVFVAHKTKLTAHSKFPSHWLEYFSPKHLQWIKFSIAHIWSALVISQLLSHSLNIESAAVYSSAVLLAVVYSTFSLRHSQQLLIFPPVVLPPLVSIRSQAFGVWTTAARFAIALTFAFVIFYPIVDYTLLSYIVSHRSENYSFWNLGTISYLVLQSITLIFLWDMQPIFLEAFVLQPIALSRQAEPAAEALLAGLRHSHTAVQRFAFLELVSLAEPQSTREREKLFNNIKDNNETGFWKPICDESLKPITKFTERIQTLLKQAQAQRDRRPIDTYAPPQIVLKASSDHNRSATAVPSVPLAKATATPIVFAKSTTNSQNSVAQSLSNFLFGPNPSQSGVNAAAPNTAKPQAPVVPVAVPPLFRSDLGTSAPTATTAPSTSASTASATPLPASSYFSPAVLQYIALLPAPLAQRVLALSTGPNALHSFLAEIGSSSLYTEQLAVRAIARLIASAKDEDLYGSVQQTLPAVISSLLDCLVAVESVLSNPLPSDNHGRRTRWSQHTALRASPRSQLLALLDELHGGLYRIVLTYGPSLREVKLSAEHKTKLHQFEGYAL